MNDSDGDKRGQEGGTGNAVKRLLGSVITLFENGFGLVLNVYYTLQSNHYTIVKRSMLIC